MIEIGDGGTHVMPDGYITSDRFIVVSRAITVNIPPRGGYIHPCTRDYFLVLMVNCAENGRIKAFPLYEMKMDPKVCDKCGQEIKHV